MPELRTGDWTRLGNEAVLGDAVTEDTLFALAESARTAARSQGYSVGWAEGQRAAREAARAEAAEAEQRRLAAETRRAQEHADAVAALAVAATHLHESVAATCARVEEQAATLAWEVVTALVGRELVSADGVDVVQRVLALMPAEPIAAVRVHPDDVATAYALTDAGVRVLPDPSLARGDVLAEADDHVLDLRVSTALDRVREALR
jgi:flagellar assembly protein FliH